MRFIRGATLQDALNAFHAAERPGRDRAERSLALRDLLNRFVSVCNTVAYVHSRGILHRDLKPQNIMLGQYDETLVVDRGSGQALRAETRRPAAARRGGADARDTGLDHADGGRGGHAGLHEPRTGRRSEPAEVGPASDCFSLGAILYAILTGGAPYRGGRLGDEVLERVRRLREFPAPRQIKPRTPSGAGGDLPRRRCGQTSRRTALRDVARTLAADVEPLAGR